MLRGVLVLRRDVCGMLRKTLLLRCSSTAVNQGDLQDELDRSVRRRHVADTSFEQLYTQYCTHPTSLPPSVPLGYPDDRVESLVNLFLSEKEKWDSKEIGVIFDRVVTSAVHPYHEFHDKFLSSEELEVVNAKLVERAQGLLKPSSTLLAQRTTPPTVSTRDEGLAMLYNSDVAFVDISDHVEDETRYMVVREMDGVLRHCNEEERDKVQTSFVNFTNQLVPTPAVLAYDDVFSERLAEGDVVQLLELLEVGYTSDHPMYVKRHTEITEAILSSEDHVNNVLLTRFLPGVLQRWAQGERRGEGLDNLISVLERYLPQSKASIDVLTELQELC